MEDLANRYFNKKPGKPHSLDNFYAQLGSNYKAVSKDIEAKGLDHSEKQATTQKQFTAGFQKLRDQYFAGTAEADMAYEGLDAFLACNEDHDLLTQLKFNFFLSAKVARESDLNKFPQQEDEWLKKLRSEYKALPLNPVREHIAAFSNLSHKLWMVAGPHRHHWSRFTVRLWAKSSKGQHHYKTQTEWRW